MVDSHYRGLGAGAQAGVVAECQPPVGSISFRFKAAGLQRRLDQRHGADQVARSAPTHLNLVQARWFETKVGIEGRNRPDFIDSGTGESRYLFNPLFGDEAKFVLDG